MSSSLKPKFHSFKYCHGINSFLLKFINIIRIKEGDSYSLYNKPDLADVLITPICEIPIQSQRSSFTVRPPTQSNHRDPHRLLDLLLSEVKT